MGRKQLEYPPPGEYWCSRCGETKPHTEYTLTGVGDANTRCKRCVSEVAAVRKKQREAERPSPIGASIVVPISTPSAPNLREHWAVRARRVRMQRAAVGWTWRAAGLSRSAPLPCVVTLTRINRRRLDDDNLRGALKAVRDEVARLLGVDDGSDQIEWRYAQATDDPARVRIEIDERQ